jgi:hypothetical protein
VKNMRECSGKKAMQPESDFKTATDYHLSSQQFDI